MQSKIQLITDADLADAYSLMVSNGLYSKEGMLYPRINYLNESKAVDAVKIVIAKKQDKPVGIAALFRDEQDVNVYVKPEHRRQGIGSLMVQEIIKNENRYYIKANEGIDEDVARNFFSSLRIPTIEFNDFSTEAANEIKSVVGDLSTRDLFQKPGVIPAIIKITRLKAHRKENYISQEELEEGIRIVKEDLEKTIANFSIGIESKKKIVRRYHKNGTLPQEGEIFVFGSNLAGRHGRGAALVAMTLGAVRGVPRGLQGQTYAIPIKNKNIISMSIHDVAREIRGFAQFTYDRPDLNFFVTAVGCGLGFFKDYEIAPLFKMAVNCSFPENWKPYLEDE